MKNYKKLFKIIIICIKKINKYRKTSDKHNFKTLSIVYKFIMGIIDLVLISILSQKIENFILMKIM